MMSFILLGKGADARVVMLSEVVHETRKDATDALSALTSEPTFEHWDSEVWVVDLEKATPVLLVRPAAPQAAGASDEASLPNDEEVALEGPDTGMPEDDTESLLVEDDEVVIAVEGGLEAPDDVDLATALTELGIGEAETLDEEPPAEHIESDDSIESGPLRDALARTAAHMEASGIVPPDSVGPEEADTEVDVEADAENTETGDVSEPASDEAQAWPWTAASEQDSETSSFSLSALEEPGIDEGSLIRGAGDEDTMASARPVILGSYDDVMPSEPMSVGEAETGSIESEDLAAALAEVMAESEPIVEPEQAAQTVTEQDASDSAAAEGEQLTCDDCIYFHTCPNKEEREPSSCGSFQWK